MRRFYDFWFGFVFSTLFWIAATRIMTIWREEAKEPSPLDNLFDSGEAEQKFGPPTNDYFTSWSGQTEENRYVIIGRQYTEKETINHICGWADGLVEAQRIVANVTEAQPLDNATYFAITYPVAQQLVDNEKYQVLRRFIGFNVKEMWRHGGQE